MVSSGSLGSHRWRVKPRSPGSCSSSSSNTETQKPNLPTEHQESQTNTTTLWAADDHCLTVHGDRFAHFLQQIFARSNRNRRSSPPACFHANVLHFLLGVEISFLHKICGWQYWIHVYIYEIWWASPVAVGIFSQNTDEGWTDSPIITTMKRTFRANKLNTTSCWWLFASESLVDGVTVGTSAKRKVTNMNCWSDEMLQRIKKKTNSCNIHLLQTKRWW